MNQILYNLCWHCVGIMGGWYPFPAWAIAQQSGVSISTARRHLRELKKDGLVKTFSIAVSEEYPLPYNGWTITEKAKETEEYKTAWKKEKKLCRDVFGTDMFPEEEQP